jgi:hypothetical protein
MMIFFVLKAYAIRRVHSNIFFENLYGHRLTSFIFIIVFLHKGVEAFINNVIKEKNLKINYNIKNPRCRENKVEMRILRRRSIFRLGRVQTAVQFLKLGHTFHCFLASKAERIFTKLSIKGNIFFWISKAFLDP